MVPRGHSSRRTEVALEAFGLCDAVETDQRGVADSVEGAVEDALPVVRRVQSHDAWELCCG